MAQPPSILNLGGQYIDTGWDVTGQSLLGLVIDEVNVTYTPKAGRRGVATHKDGATFVAGEGIIAIGGVRASGIVMKALIGDDGVLPVTLVPSKGALVNKSGTITAGGTQQTLAAALSTRRYLFIQNLDPAEDLWINFTTAAVVDQPSIRIEPGQTFVMEGSFVSTELVSVIAATTGHKFTAKEA